MQTLASHSELFPIKDAPSATLMMAKAARLHTAGVIGAAEREKVMRRAEYFLNGGHTVAHRSAAGPTTAELLLT